MVQQCDWLDTICSVLKCNDLQIVQVTLKAAVAGGRVECREGDVLHAANRWCGGRRVVVCK